ncbi:DNA excision repair protein ERCC-6 [Nematostella vectensis]|uniref:DNA excision repair protein ERCC-6 n=1 Tax=Nematostella vectensis TaxID=45351 RepID=UPI00207704B1|nr:DNA excision repair protein ERCC-6 [Nematostella vectensis]
MTSKEFTPSRKSGSCLDLDETEKNSDDKDCQNTRHSSSTYGIAIDSSRIRSVPLEEQSTVLRDLGIGVFDQEEFEEGILKQVDEAIAVKETEALIQGWVKDLKAVNDDIESVHKDLEEIDRLVKGLSSTDAHNYDAGRRLEAVKKHRENKHRQLQKLEARQKALNNKLGIGAEDAQDEEEVETSTEDAKIMAMEERIKIMKKLEEQRDQLIKTGKMTPFEGSINNTANSATADNVHTTTMDYPTSLTTTTSEEMKSTVKTPEDDDDDNGDDYNDDGEMEGQDKDSGDDYIPEEEELRDSWNDKERPNLKSNTRKRPAKDTKNNQRHANVKYVDEEDEVKPKKVKKKTDNFKHRALDDGDDGAYHKRIRHVRIQSLLKKQGLNDNESSDEEEFSDMEFDNNYKVPGQIWHKLYKYQQTGVKWLWELHCQQAGGIIGDEMGLGKTIQTVVFLAGLKYSGISARKSRRDQGLGPVLIVCPVTVLHQWVKEFHKWWPEFRVAVLHDTGSFSGRRDALVRKICKAHGVIVTSYSGVRCNQDALLAQRWDYVILDEGHKIRNPDAEITLACKQIRTPHRIILSGSPMQNNLRELWSLFDFVFPGKLGTLPVFLTEFSVPITTGGYANASKVQVQTAYKCACVLRDTINPYLLRRLKKDVKMDLELPNKNEQVLFCRLSDEQRQLYEQYLDSREVQSILAGKYKVFPGLIMLRKICNHPDLTSEAGSLIKAKQDEEEAKRGVVKPRGPDDGYGDWRRAGKMVVVEALLKMWKTQGHRVLVFSQTRQMLNILELFVSSRGYNYRRMDGSTSVATRQPLVNKFNQDESIFVFLLTTRVGGLGVNLTGADRVIIYDPDWNPSTDTQARERSWRIGQRKQVTIYRLLTTGTIEEKIYHRQIFKQFLTNRVLEDPKQRRFFKTNDLYELFTLDDSYKKQGTETGAIFAGTNCQVKVSGSRKKKSDPRLESRAVVKSHVSSRSGKRPITCPPRDAKKQSTCTTGSSRSDDFGFTIDERDIQEIQRQKRDPGPAIPPPNPDANPEDATGNDMNLKSDAGSVLESSKANEEGIGTKSPTVVGVTNVTEKTDSKARSIDSNQSIDKQSTKDSNVSRLLPLHTETSLGMEDMPKRGDLIPSASFQARSSSSKDESQLLASLSSVPSSGSSSMKAKDGACHKPVRPGSHKSKLVSLSDKQLKKKIRIRKKKKRKKIEGHVIDNLDYHVSYSAGSGASDTGTEKPDSWHDDVILKALFKRGGVHSALQHDVIMESGNADYTLVENEANRVAQQAVQALKKSRQRCLGATSGIPTWTGASGSSGFTDTRRPKLRFGKKRPAATSSVTAESDESKPTKRAADQPLFSGAMMGVETADHTNEPASSADLLARMRARNNILPNEETGPSYMQSTEHDALLAEMSDFVAHRGRVPFQASTDELVARFKDQLPKNNSAVFRALLRRICVFSRGEEKGGIWTLKPEFA